MAHLADYIQYGASPRATIYLSLAARAYAFLQGRAYVTPHDVNYIAPWVLRHRIIPNFAARSERMTADDLIEVAWEDFETEEEVDNIVELVKADQIAQLMTDSDVVFSF